MRFEDFLTLLEKTRRDLRALKSDQRSGQILSNTLFTVREDLYSRITGTEFDPFYDDDKVVGALVWIMEHWD
jgi:hypothetical protein